MHRRIPTVLCLAGAIAAGSMTAGCGGKAAPAGAASASSTAATGLSPVAAIQDAARATQGSSSARTETSMVSQSKGQSVTLRASGLFDYQAKRGQYEMTMSGGLGQALGQLSGKGGTDMTIKVVLDQSTVYMNMPLPGMSQWIALDAGAFGVGGSASLDPTRSLLQLDQIAADGVHLVGPGQVRDTHVTHYQALVDPAKALSTFNIEGGALADVAKGMNKIPVDVYVDDQHRIREIDETVDATLPASLGGGTSHTKLSSQFYDYGVPVHVDIPQNAQRLDLPMTGGQS